MNMMEAMQESNQRLRKAQKRNMPKDEGTMTNDEANALYDIILHGETARKMSYGELLGKYEKARRALVSISHGGFATRNAQLVAKSTLEELDKVKEE